MSYLSGEVPLVSERNQLQRLQHQEDIICEDVVIVNEGSTAETMKYFAPSSPYPSEPVTVSIPDVRTAPTAPPSKRASQNRTRY